MRPLTESLRYLDAANLNSDEFNQFARSLVRDVSSAYNTINELDNALRDSLLTITEENLALHQRLVAQEAMLKSLEETIQNGSDSYKTTYHSFYNSANIGAEQIFHDSMFGLVTLPQSDLVASVYKDYDADFLAKSVNISFVAKNPAGETVKNYSIATRKDLVHIIDRDVSTYWIERISQPSTVDYLDFFIQLDASTKISPTLVSNALSVCPYPIYNLRLLEVSYTDLSNTVHRLNRLTADDATGFFDLPEGVIGNIKLFHPDITAKSITLKFRQANYRAIEGNKREFTFGFRGINVEKLSLTSDNGKFLFTHKLPAGKYFSLVNVPIATDYNLNDMIDDGQLRYELFLGENTSLPFAFNTRIRSNISAITVRVSMTRKGLIVPYLNGLRLDFEIK